MTAAFSPTDVAFYKHLAISFHKSNPDWTLVLEKTRDRIGSRTDLSTLVLKEINGFESRGWIAGKLEEEEIPLIPSEGVTADILKNILSEFTRMENSDELPSYEQTYKFCRLALHYYCLSTDKNPNQILDDMLAVLVSKSKDYSQAFRRIGYPGIRARVWEKICRIVSLSGNLDAKPNYEPLEDSMKDLLGYAIILVALAIEAEPV